MVDKRTYRGHTYRRYPESKRRHHRSYFYATEPRRGFLHRHVWEDEFGPIPPGHEIHHRDEDTFNNEPDNLECLPIGEHRAMHLSARSRTPEHLAHLNAARVGATEWHKSDDGRAWHAENARRCWAKRTTTPVTCICCSATVDTYFPNRTKFCGSACTQWYHRRGPD